MANNFFLFRPGREDENIYNDRNCHNYKFDMSFFKAPMKGSENKARLEGRTVVITGANTGIGKVTALDMSGRGARVIILCRNQDKAKEAAAEIAKETGGVVECGKLDLSSLASVRECAKTLLEREDKIDLLVNNAGVMTCPNWKTEDGFDMQLGTNHLGHFLLTELLTPLLKKSAASGFRPRIVIVSSVAHEMGSMNWEDLNWEKSYDKNKAYAQSKLANVLHAKELARRLEDTGIAVFRVVHYDFALKRNHTCILCGLLKIYICFLLYGMPQFSL